MMGMIERTCAGVGVHEVSEVFELRGERRGVMKRGGEER